MTGLVDLAIDVWKEYSDPSRSIRYDADYSSLDCALRSAHAIAGLAALSWQPTGPRSLVEIGTDTGAGALAMAMASATHMIVYSFDVRPECADPARARSTRLGIHNVRFLVGDARRVAEDVPPPIDLVYIDGDHSYEACLFDLETLAPLIEADGRLVCHDCWDARLPEGRNGVVRAIREFLRTHTEWYGCHLGWTYFVLTRSRQHPILGWTEEAE